MSLLDQSPALPPWSLTISGIRYILLCLLASLAIRVVVFIFRAWAVQRGDFPDADPDKNGNCEPGKGRTFVWAFWESFKGFSRSKAHADLWLNFLIGFAELAAYPILLKTGQMAVIAGWLAVRTAGSWGGWKVSRTSFNRFLLGTIMEIAIAISA